MGVDVIIAVDVEFPLYRPDQLNSVLDISAQMLTILIRNQTREKLSTLTDDDVLIRPELGQFGTTDFANIELAIEPGSRAAAAMEDRLRGLALDEAAYTAHVEMRRRRLTAIPDRIEFVDVESDSGLAAEVLEARVKTAPGDPVYTDQLAADASALHGLYAFERVGYELVERGGATGVRFDAVSKSWGPNYLLFGLSLQDDFEGATAFNVAARLTRTEINALGAEWRNDLQLGNRPFYRTELYQPTGLGSRFFVAPRLEIGQTNFNVFENGARLGRYRVTRGEIALDAGRELGRWGEFRAGIFRGYSDARRKVGDPLLGGIEADTGGTFLQLAVDTLDDGQIPRNGVLGKVRLINSSNRLGADNDADAIESSLSLVKSFGRHTIELGALVNVATEDSDLVENFYPLGGFLRLSGLARGEISGPHAGVARIVYYRRTGNTGGDLFEIPLYLGASLEAGNVWQRRSDIGLDEAITSGSLFLGLDTNFGPLYLAAGLAEGGRTNFYLSLGTPP